MTPEERAAALMDRIVAASEGRADSLILPLEIAAAIREAVDAETEACARVAWAHGDRPEFHGAFAARQLAKGVAFGIARDIRQRARRGASPDAAAKPAP